MGDVNRKQHVIVGLDEALNLLKLSSDRFAELCGVNVKTVRDARKLGRLDGNTRNSLVVELQRLDFENFGFMSNV